MGNIFLGIAAIVLGIYTIRSTYKHPDSQLISYNFKGYAAGTACIIFGVVIIFK